MSPRLFGNRDFNVAFIAAIPISVMGLYMIMRDDIHWSVRGLVAVMVSGLAAIMTLSGYIILQRQRDERKTESSGE